MRDVDGLVVGKFPRSPDGGAMAVELTGAVSSGDVLVAVNGARLRGLPPAEQRSLLMGAPWPRTLTFRRAAVGGGLADEAAALSAVGGGAAAAASAASLGVEGGGAGGVGGGGSGVLPGVSGARLELVPVPGLEGHSAEGLRGMPLEVALSRPSVSVSCGSGLDRGCESWAVCVCVCVCVVVVVVVVVVQGFGMAVTPMVCCDVRGCGVGAWSAGRAGDVWSAGGGSGRGAEPGWLPEAAVEVGGVARRGAARCSSGCYYRGGVSVFG